MAGSLVVLSKCFLITVNTFMALVALGILGGGLYVYLNYAVFEAFLSEEAVIYVACSGAIVFIFSLLGLLGAICNQWKFLVPYLLIIVLFIAAEVLVGIIALNYLGVLDDTVFDISQNNTLDDTEVLINNFILKTYHTCCVSNDNFCSNVGADPDFCAQVLFCDNGLVSPPCIEEPVATGSKTVDQVVCSTLQGFNLEEGSPIIGAAPASCGGGDPGSFVNNIVTAITDQLEIAGYAAIGLGILEILLVLFTTYLIFRGKDIKGMRRAFTGNFAVAVPEPTVVRYGEHLRNSVPVAQEEFEMDMNSVHSSQRSSGGAGIERRSVDRRSARLPLQGAGNEKFEF